MRRSTSILFLAAVSALAACNGGSKDPAKLTDSGYAALGKSDWKGAQSDFDAALAVLQPTDAGFKRAKMGQVEALIHTDAAKARDEFLALAKGMSSQVEPNDYIAVASKLTGERKFMDAIAVLEVGLKAHPEHPKVKAIGDRIKAEAEKAGDEGALKALKGLGYL
jgi:hypothetical protein